MVKKLSVITRLVLFLKSEGFKSSQIRYICVERLRIKGTLVYRKISYYCTRLEEREAERRWKHDNIHKKLQISGILDELNSWKKQNKEKKY
jgi:hypothetical protein